jgi:phosphatidylglycerophosphate synthase
MSSVMAASPRWFTRANALTLVRLIAAPVLYLAILDDRVGLACLVFWIAVATDFADGWVARRLDEATPLGGLMDHGVDALFVVLGTTALACTGALPPLLAPLIAIAFVQYTLDSRFLGGGVLAASRIGRWNGIAYYVIVAVPIMRDALGLAWPGAALVSALGWALAASTLLSIGDRLRRLIASRHSRA